MRSNKENHATNPPTGRQWQNGLCALYVLPFVCIGFLFGAGGCNGFSGFGDCQQGDVWFSGDVLMQCEWEDNFMTGDGFSPTSVADCGDSGRVCLERDGGAACVWDDISCDVDGGFCEGDTYSRCRFGYLSEREDCSEQGGYCVAAPDGSRATCAVAPDVCDASSEPQCSTSSTSGDPDMDFNVAPSEVLRCNDYYFEVDWLDSCESFEICWMVSQEDGDDQVECVLDTQTCVTDESMVCVDNRVGRCGEDGYPVLSDDCGDHFCIEVDLDTDMTALCSVTEEPCPADAESFCLDANTVAQCRYGYPWTSRNCEYGCVQMGGEEADCQVAASLCGSGANYVCDGFRRIDCATYDAPVAVADCGTVGSWPGITTYCVEVPQTGFADCGVIPDLCPIEGARRCSAQGTDIIEICDQGIWRYDGLCPQNYPVCITASDTDVNCEME